ncbi:hypothetical protein ARTHROSP310_27590 [Arthrobacter sp. AD-310]
MFPGKPIPQRRHGESTDAKQRKADDCRVHPKGNHVVAGIALIAQREKVPIRIFGVRHSVFLVIDLMMIKLAGLRIIKTPDKDSEKQKDRNHERGKDPERNPAGSDPMPRRRLRGSFPHNALL